jgi:hypothetical protein
MWVPQPWRSPVVKGQVRILVNPAVHTPTHQVEGTGLPELALPELALPELALRSSRWIGISSSVGLSMKVLRQLRVPQEGKIGWVILWLLGVPIPVLLLLFLLRGCT